MPGVTDMCFTRRALDRSASWEQELLSPVQEAVQVQVRHPGLAQHLELAIHWSVQAVCHQQPVQ